MTVRLLVVVDGASGLSAGGGAPVTVGASGRMNVTGVRGGVEVCDGGVDEYPLVLEIGEGGVGQGARWRDGGGGAPIAVGASGRMMITDVRRGVITFYKYISLWALHFACREACGLIL